MTFDLSLIILAIVVYLGIGCFIFGDHYAYDDDIQAATIVLWPLVLVGGMLLGICMFLISVVKGCIKLIMEVIDSVAS